MSAENLTPLDVVDMTRALVAIPSVNPSLSPDGQGEEEVARLCSTWLESWGFEVSVTHAAPGRPNVVGRWGDGGPTLILNGHMDTVGVQGMTVAPFEAEVRDGKLFGRGSCDMKGGVAAILSAARAVAADPRGAKGTLLVVLTSDEEHASIGVDHLLANGLTADAAIVTEPTAMAIMPAHKGFMWTRFRVHGRAAHGSRPDVGRDAIRGAGKILSALHHYEAEAESGPRHPLLGWGSIHAGTIEGGSAPSVYPEGCELVVETRLLPGEGPEVVRSRLGAVLEAAALHDDQLRVEMGDGLFRPGSDLPVDHPLVGALSQALRDEGLPVSVEGMTAWVEAAAFHEAGIPALCFGPGSIEKAHSADEFVRVEELHQAAAVLERATRIILGQ